MKDFSQFISEVLTKSDPIEKWIHDFVHSDNPKFAGKSKEERIKMAQGAYYGAQKEEVELDEAMEVQPHELKQIHKEYTGLKNKSTSDVLKMHKSMHRVQSQNYTAGEMGGKEGLISDLMHQKHGKQRMAAYHALSNKDKKSLSEESLEERNKANATMRKNMDASRGLRAKALNPAIKTEYDDAHQTQLAQNKALGRALRKEESGEHHDVEHVMKTMKKVDYDTYTKHMRKNDADHSMENKHGVDTQHSGSFTGKIHGAEIGHKHSKSGEKEYYIKEETLDEGIPSDGQHTFKSAKSFKHAASKIGATVKDHGDSITAHHKNGTHIGEYDHEQKRGWLYAPSHSREELKEETVEESRGHKILATALGNMERMKTVQIPTPAERKAQLEKQKQDQVKKEETMLSFKEAAQDTLPQHKVIVTVSDPHHQAVSQRKEKVMKRVVVKALGRDEAKAKAEDFYKKKGYKVHDSEYHSKVPAATLKTEEVELEESWEVYDTKTRVVHSKYPTQRKAQNAMNKLNDKHPGYETPGNLIASKFGARASMNKEELHPNQKKLDMNKNGKLDADDFKKLRKEETLDEVDMGQADRTLRSQDKSGNTYHVKDKSGKIISTHNNQSDAIKGALKRDDYKVVKEQTLDEVTSPMQKLRDAHDRHMEKALAANKAGDDEAVKVHQVYMQKIRAKMDKLKRNEEIDLTEMENLCELSKATLGSYVAKASHSAANKMYSAGYTDHMSHAERQKGNDALGKAHSKHAGKTYSKAVTRLQGIERATDKLAKEEVDLQEQHPIAPSLTRHTVVVHVSDPDAPEEGKQKKALSVLTTHPKSAEATARKHFEKKGWKVHSVKSNNPVHEEAEELDEISQLTKDKYVTAAKRSKAMHSQVSDDYADPESPNHNWDKADHHLAMVNKRGDGIRRALRKEETLDEANVKVGSHVTLHPQMKGGSEEKVKVVGKNGDHIDVEYNDYMGRKQVKSVHHSFVKEDKEETMVSYKEFMASIEEGRIDDLKDKLAADREKRLNKMDYSKEKEDKKNPITKVKGHSYGAGEEEGEDEAGEKAKPAEPAQKRGRGRPAGSKSGVTKYN